jgi:cell division protein FtsN
MRMRAAITLGAVPWVVLGAVLVTGTWSARLVAQAAPVDSTPYVRARDMVSNGEVEQGRHVIDSLLKAATPGTPAYAEGLYWRAAVAPNARDAERDYRQVVVDYPLSPRVPDALLRLGQLEAARGDRDAALQHFQRVVLEYPDSPRRAEASYWVANTYLLHNDLQRGCAANADALARVASTNVELKNRIDFQQLRCRNVQLARGATAPASSQAPAAASASAPAAKSVSREVPVTESRAAADTQRAAPAESASVARAADSSSSAAAESTTVTTLPSREATKRVSSSRSTSVTKTTATTPASRKPVTRSTKVVKTTRQADSAKAMSAAESTAVSTTRSSTIRSSTSTTVASGSRGYAVQVAAYKSRADADSLAARLRARGYPSHVDGDTTPYRVRIGHYHTRADAVAVLRQLKAKKIDGFVAEF